MQLTVRFLTDLRDEIIALHSPNSRTDEYFYLGGQIDLLNKLIRTIGEGALGDGTRSVQGGIELLSAEES